MAEKTLDEELAISILGQAVVDAMGGIARIERRPPTEEEAARFAGSGLVVGDMLTFVPKAH